MVSPAQGSQRDRALGPEGVGKDIVFEIIDVNRGDTAVQVGRHRQGEELPHPDAQADLEQQPAEPTAGMQRIVDQTQSSAGQLDGRERAALEHDPRHQHHGQRRPHERQAGPGRAQQPRRRPKAVGRAAREHAAVAGAAHHDAAPSPGMALLHEIGHTRARKITVGALALVVPVEAGDIGMDAVHQRRLKCRRRRGKPDGELAADKPPRGQHARQGGHAAVPERAVEHAARKAIDLDDEKAPAVGRDGQPKPRPAGEPVDAGLTPEDEIVEHGRSCNCSAAFARLDHRTASHPTRSFVTRHPASPLPPIVAAVRELVETRVLPIASALEHADSYPHDLVADMRALGLFGALVPRQYGGLGLDVTTYARTIEELCRGWMSLAGVINSHTMAALIVLHHGTEEQRVRLLPRFASGEARGGLCLTEPHAGSDVQAIRTVAKRDGDRYLISGSKMFVTNGREGNTFALLALTDPKASPPHKGMSCFIVEKGPPGLEVVKSIAKLGYKGVDTAELLFDNFPCPARNLVGPVEGRGFQHVMSGLETGRINIAARAVGVAQAALDEAARHEAGAGETQPALADIATRVEAARLLTYWAAGMKDRSERCDLEAGMAKLYASETAQDVAVETMKLVGPPAQSQRRVVERLYRDTPLMIIGERTNEIQRTIICKNLLQRHGERPGALVSRDGLATEQKHMVLLVRQTVEKDVIPMVEEYEPAGTYPAAVVEKLGELGILGMLVPFEYGGLGLDIVTYAMIIEELARGWTTVAGLVARHAVAAHAIAGMEPRELRERWLSPLTRGERRVCLVDAAGTSAAR